MASFHAQVLQDKRSRDLLDPLIQAVAGSLPCLRKSTAFVVEPELAERNRACLIDLSVDAINPVIQPLFKFLQQCLTKSADDRSTEADIQYSVTILLQTMAAALAHQFASKGKEADLVDPTVLRQLLDLLYSRILAHATPEDLATPSSIPCQASQLVYALTARNFDMVQREFKERLTTLTSSQDDSPDLGYLNLIPYVHFTTTRLTQLLRELHLVVGTVRKNVQLGVASGLCVAIDKWMDVYPDEFITLQQGDAPLCQECDHLFEAYYAIAEKTINRKAACWPVMIRLLLLSPNILLNIYTEDQTQNTDPNKTKRRYLDGLRAAFTKAKPPLSETAVKVYATLCIAATFVEKSSKTSCLRHMVPPIENDLKGKLFDPSQPFFEKIQRPEEDLLVTCLTAFYKLNHRSTVNDYLFPFISKDDTPTQFRCIAIRCVLNLNQSNTTHRPDATIDYCLSHLSSALRNLFQQKVRQVASNSGTRHGEAGRLSKKDMKAIAEHQSELELLEHILNVLYNEPKFATYNEARDRAHTSTSIVPEPSDSNDLKQLQETTQLMNGLCSCLQQVNLSPLASLAAKTLIQLHKPEQIDRWDATDHMRGFWESGSSVLISLAMPLFGYKRDFDTNILAVLRDLMRARVAYVAQRRAYLDQQTYYDSWYMARMKLQVVALLSMCSASSKQLELGVDLLDMLCQEADLLQSHARSASEGEQPTTPINLGAEHLVFKQVVVSARQVLTSGSLKAVQKTITRELRQIYQPSEGTIQAWETAFSLWQGRVKEIRERHAEETARDNNSSLSHLGSRMTSESGLGSVPPDFASKCFFLCSLGGVCTLTTRGSVLSLRIKDEADLSGTTTALLHLRQFVPSMLELIKIEPTGLGLTVRETVKEALSSELHAVLVPGLLDYIHHTCQDVFEADQRENRISSQGLAYLEQVIPTVRKLLDMDTSKHLQYLALAEVEPLMDVFMDHLRLSTDNQDAIKVKTWFCKLVSRVMALRDTISFRHEIKFRNRTMDKLLAFVSTAETTRPTGSEIASVELDVSCVSAMSDLLLGLPLQPVEDAPKDRVAAKSRLFLKYFTFLMNLTNRCNRVLHPEVSPETMDINSSLSKSGHHKVYRATQQPKESLHRRFSSAVGLESEGSERPGRTRLPSVAEHGPGPASLSRRETSKRWSSKVAHADAAGPNHTAAAGPTTSSTGISGTAAGSAVVGGSSAAGAVPAAPAGSNGLIGGLTGGSAVNRLDPVANSSLFQQERVLRSFDGLREQTTSAMSHLLAANVEVGLGHAIGMGYHFDPGVRLAFTEVLNRVLQSGAEFDTLAESVLSDRYGKLVDLCLDPSLAIPIALASVVDTDELDDLAALLVAVFQSRRSLLMLCGGLVRQEVTRSQNAGTLLRRNSLATKVVAHAFRVLDNGYLYNTLGPVLQDLIADERCYELDPNRTPQQTPEELNQSRHNVEDLCTAILTRLRDSIEDMPTSLRGILMVVRAAVASQFPEAELGAVGAIVFLRYISPAIVSPVQQGLLPDSTRLPLNVLRALLFASKVLQNIANGLQFASVKEPHMQGLNPFVNGEFDPMNRYLNALSALDEVAADELAALQSAGLEVLPGVHALSTPASEATVSNEDAAEDPTLVLKESDVLALHRVLHSYSERLGRDPASLQSAVRGGSGSVLDQVNTLLVQLGDPPKSKSNDRRYSYSATVDENKKLEDFLARHKFLATPTDEIEARNLFYRRGTTEDHRPVFYYIARRYMTGELDAEHIMYHALLTLKPVISGPFELVVDLTQFSRANEPSGPALEQFAGLIPPSLTQNLRRVYVLNAPRAFLGLAKRLNRYVLGSKFHKKVAFVNLPELQAQIPKLQLPASTLRLLDAPEHFTNVSLLGTNKRATPVQVRVGETGLQIQFTERVKVLHQMAQLTDVHATEDISELVLPAADDGPMTIEYARGADVLSLVAAVPVMERLSKAVAEVLRRHKLSKPEISSEWKVMRPSAVPGTLLNMALLNLGSAQPKLRLAAYNLLAAVTTTFDFNINNQLLEALGLAIPENNSSFIISVSERLAGQEPKLTSEFLDECLAGLSTSTSEQKHLCLEYMQPWLHNVQHLEGNVDVLILGLVKVTITQPELYTSLQAKVWFTMGKISTLVPGIMRAFLNTARECGAGSAEAEIMADCAVTLAAANKELVARIILDEVLECLRQTSQGAKESLPQHPSWPYLAVLTRFLLTLSFNDRLHVENNLPALLHIITMLMASGGLQVRAAIHAITINILQSLCTTLTLDAEQLRRMRVRLQELTIPRTYLQFGISGTRDSSEAVFLTRGRSGPGSLRKQKSLLDDSVRDLIPLKLDALQHLVNNLWETLEDVEPANARWRSEWHALTQAAAFRANPALQPRAFVTMGTTSRHMPHATLAKILDNLATALKRQDVDLVDSIMMALARLLAVVVPRESGLEFHALSFWTAVTILHLGSAALFTSALAVIETVLTAFEDHRVVDGHSLIHVLEPSRARCQQQFGELDASIGMSFADSFDFAMAGSLVRGLQHSQPGTVTRTIRLLSQLLNIERGMQARNSTRLSLTSFKVRRSMLGYLTVLWPIADEVHDFVVHLSGNEDDLCYRALLQVEDATQEDMINMVTLTIARLKQCQELQQRRLLFKFLSQAIRLQPEIFTSIHGDLFPLLDAAVTQAQDPAVIGSCHVLLHELLKQVVAPATGDVPVLRHAFPALSHAATLEQTVEAEELHRRFALIANIVVASTMAITKEHQLEDKLQPKEVLRPRIRSPVDLGGISMSQRARVLSLDSLSLSRGPSSEVVTDQRSGTAPGSPVLRNRNGTPTLMLEQANSEEAEDSMV